MNLARKPKRSLRAALLCIAFAAIGCTADLEEEITADNATAYLISECDDCGLNGPVLAGTDVNELALNGDENGAKARIVSVTTHPVGGFTYAAKLAVHGDVLFGRIDDGGSGFVDVALEESAIIEVLVMVDGHPVFRDLEIAVVSHLNYWVDPNRGDRATVYHFKEALPGGGQRDVCPDIESNDDDGNGDFPDLLQNQMFAFAGDRYEATGRVIVGGDADGWVTLACRGSAPSKLHLARHTQASSNPSFVTDVRARQAMLYAVRADYCGVGEANTTSGHAIRYLDAGSWFSDFYETRFEDELSSFEALWDEYGAICVDAPRLDSNAEVYCNGQLVPPCRADKNFSVDWGDARFKTGNPS